MRQLTVNCPFYCFYNLYFIFYTDFYIVTQNTLKFRTMNSASSESGQNMRIDLMSASIRTGSAGATSSAVAKSTD